MTIRLQEFGHRESAYERPNQKWVCGWAAEGRPCRLGPDGRGRCPAAAQGACAPVREGDRWVCTRPEVFGGACPHGPRPDGACSRPEPEQTVCQPRLGLRARRGRLTMASCALAVGALAVLLAGPRGLAFLSPGPLTSAHAVMETRPPFEAGRPALPPAPEGAGYCAHCHERARSSGGIVQPVTDRACLACHVAEAHHAARSTARLVEMQLDQRAGRAAMASGCTSCHGEHGGREATLSRVPDARCTRCHADLSAWARATPADVASPAPAPLPRVEPPLPARTAASITSFAVDHPEFAVLRDDRIDAARIRFEHHDHFDAGRMADDLREWLDRLVAAGTPDHDVPVRRRADGALELECAACHRPDDAGRAMRETRFEEHCAQCHDLGTVKMSGGEEPLPHGAEALAFARLAAQTWVKPAPPRRGRVPASPEPEDGPDAPKPPAIDPADVIPKSRCSSCHYADPFDIEAPGIPARWLPRATFSHRTHRFVGDCLACHGAGASDGGAPGADEHAARPDLKWTGRTKEIMLPSIAVCRTCHAPPAVAGPSAVRHDCVLCHEYHAPSLSDVAGGAAHAITSSEYPTRRSNRPAAGP